MKFMKTLAVILMVMAVFSSVSFAKAPKSAITNTAHDLRNGVAGGNQWKAASFTLCSFCHVAHKPGNPLIPDPISGNLAPAKAGPLLWAHQFSNQATYGVYTSDTFAGYGTDIADLGTGNTGATTSVSNLCLSCHDGTIAVNSFYEAVTDSTFRGSIPEGTVKITGSAVIFDMTQQHPVNFTYNAGLATAAGLLVPASVNSVDGAGEIPLFSGKMQCATCHDPHNGASSIFEQQFPTQASGSFCTYCHL
ncbi:MAG: hypothetical protein H0X25_09595 [Acidobacteriales bacterium]|nr:hypothetical protein [Terriglobales bacterium]